MALVDNAWYVDFGNGSSTGHFAVTAWATGTAKSCGNFVRATAPTAGNERVFVCIVGGTTHATTQPTWVVTRGARNTDNTVTWQEATGIAALNGDLTNTPDWNTVKNTAVTLGQVIKNVAANLILICTTAGTAGNGAEPTWAAYTTAGATTADNTVTWTTLGASFSAWASPHARIKNALTSTWAQPGNTIYVASEHAETNTSISAVVGSSVSTQAAPVEVLCVTKTTVPPTSANLTTGATVSSTTGSLSIGGGSSNYAYFYGIAFTGGSAGNNAALNIFNTTSQLIGDLYFKSCSFSLGGGLSTELINYAPGSGPAAGGATFDGCAFTFSHAGQSIAAVIIRARHWNCTFAATGTVPTTLFSSIPSMWMELIGCDLSAIAAGGTIIGTSGTTAGAALLRECKLGASVSFGTSLANAFAYADLVNCDSGSTNYRQERIGFAGALSTETTIVRSGGASDGTTAISWKVVTNASAKWIDPFECFPIAIWNSTTGSSVTVTVHATSGLASGAFPNNDDIWIDVDYLGDSTTPKASLTSNNKADILASGVAYTTDSNSWGGSPSGGTFAMTVTFTPQKIGYIYVRVKCAKVSTTFYIDPLAVLS